LIWKLLIKAVEGTDEKMKQSYEEKSSEEKKSPNKVSMRKIEISGSNFKKKNPTTSKLV